MELGTHNKWVKELRNYLPNQSDTDIIKYCMSYTLQSFKAKENMNKFKWEQK